MTVDTGLAEEELEQIRSVLSRHPIISGAILYGSRAKGVATASSDVDLALLGTEDSLLAEEIASELEELPFPHRFDVRALSAIKHPPLLEHIQRVGIRIY